jgi:branched-chain amino acid transport system ATP-binding protein
MFGAALEPAIGGAFAHNATAASVEPALALINVSLSFGGVQALSNVDLAVKPGDIHAIIGPNGAGKSSLINVISGIYRPDRGVVKIGKEIFARVPTPRLSRLGVTRTFQNLALFPKLSVIENVIVGLAGVARASFVEQILGVRRARAEEAEARQRADEIIALLGLKPVADSLVGALPYGLQKRVDLARALVSRPKIILLDEPMAGMTATEKREMAEFVAAARARLKAAVILIEHDIGVVMTLSDRITVLDYGRKIADGSPTEVRANPAVIDAYLGVAREENVMENAA